MKNFMDENFLLHNQTGVEIYHHIKDLPIIDYHCHLNPQEIAEDKIFENITQMWLGGDHYKWRLMRQDGVPETHITGNAPDKEKFIAFCQTIEKSIGNPVYHWAHMELKKYFGYDGIITGDEAGELYDYCNTKVKALNVATLLKVSNVEWLATTDDPIDTLAYHGGNIKPTFRPSGLLDIEKTDFASYIKKLADVVGESVSDIPTLEKAIKNRIQYFADKGCKISDHSLEPPMFGYNHNLDQAKLAFTKAIKGDTLTQAEIIAYKTHLMMVLGAEYVKHGWGMQLHIGAQRNNNKKMFDLVGPDTGFDSINDLSFSLPLNQMLSAMEAKNALPKTIIYPLNPTSNEMIASTIGNFAGQGIRGRIQWGSAWWYNDTKDGICTHLKTLANYGILANFVGMLTDSRSFISYPRHDYFRRILANQLGVWVEAGEFPKNKPLLFKIAADIAYNNAKEYFV